LSQDIYRHLTEMCANRAGWESKAALRKVYACYYMAIADSLAPEINLPTLEIGSGLGIIKQFIPHCVTSDIFPNEWLDRVESAYNVEAADASVGNLIMFDVFHHLQYPGTALRECWRILCPGGRLLILDPDMGLLARFIYGLFHHEPLGFKSVIRWFVPDYVNLRDLPYYAAQANAYRIFVRGKAAQLRSDWDLLSIRRFSGFRYLASGGFSGPNLCIWPLGPFLAALDKLGDHFPEICSARLLIALQKK